MKYNSLTEPILEDETCMDNILEILNFVSETKLLIEAFANV